MECYAAHALVMLSNHTKTGKMNTTYFSNLLLFAQTRYQKKLAPPEIEDLVIKFLIVFQPFLREPIPFKRVVECFEFWVIFINPDS